MNLLEKQSFFKYLNMYQSSKINQMLILRAIFKFYYYIIRKLDMFFKFYFRIIKIKSKFFIKYMF